MSVMQRVPPISLQSLGDMYTLYQYLSHHSSTIYKYINKYIMSGLTFPPLYLGCHGAFVVIQQWCWAK